MPFQQSAVWAFIVTCCAIEFSMFVYACCVSWKRPRRCSLEITLVTIKCETFVSVLYVMLKPGLIRGSVVTLVALVNLALMNTFSVFPYFDFVCSFKVTLITTISNSLMYWLLVFPKILWRWKRKITLTASLFHMQREDRTRIWKLAFVLYVVMFLQTWLDQFLPTAPYSPILPRPHNVHSWNLDYQTTQLSQKGKFSLKLGICI